MALYIGVLYFVISLASLIRRDKVRGMLQTLQNSRSSFFALGIVVFALGLLIVMLHDHNWSDFSGIAVGIIGWGAICESLLYLFLPHRSLTSMVAYIDNKKVIAVSSIIGIILGGALLLAGLQII